MQCTQHERKIENFQHSKGEEKLCSKTKREPRDELAEGAWGQNYFLFFHLLSLIIFILCIVSLLAWFVQKYNQHIVVHVVIAIAGKFLSIVIISRVINLKACLLS